MYSGDYLLRSKVLLPSTTYSYEEKRVYPAGKLTFLGMGESETSLKDVLDSREKLQVASRISVLASAT